MRFLLRALLLLIVVPAAVACYNAGESDVEGPDPAGAGRQLVHETNSVDGARQPIRSDVQVRDPVSGGTRISVLLRDLGDAASGNFNPATLAVGVGAANSLTVQTDRGVLTLFLRHDGTLGDTADGDPITRLPIPAVENGALSFSGQVESLVLAGVYQYEFDVTTTGGPATIELTVTAQ